MGLWNVHTGPCNVNRVSCNVISDQKYVNRGPWNVTKGLGM